MGVYSTTQKFIDKAKIVHNNKFDYSKIDYINSQTKIIIICPIHGEFTQRPAEHTRGKGCNNCAKDGKASNSKEFIEKANIIYNNFYDYSKVEYITNKDKVIIICPIHGEFIQKPNSHLNGNACPKCYRDKVTSNTEEFIIKSELIHGNKYDYSKVEYKTNCINVIVICKTHGEFNTQPNNHLQGAGCPKCVLKSQYKLFNKLSNSFEKLEILWEASPKWLNKQRFDIYFPKYNIAVEYNGEQHYKSIDHFKGDLGFKITVERDNMKRQKCANNNCTLFEIKYDYNENDYNEVVLRINSVIKNFKLLKNED